MDQQSLIVKQLKDLLEGGQTYIRLESILEKVTLEASGKSVEGVPYTIWQLLEHIRLSQKDILDFSVDSGYKELQWPDDYWVKEKVPVERAQLEASKKEILQNRAEMARVIEENGDILLEKIPHGNGQTLMREAMISAEHTAYHAGEIVVMMRLLGEWR